MAGPSIQWFAAHRRPADQVDAREPQRQPGHRGRATSSSPTTRGSAASTPMDVGMFAPVFWEGRLFSWIFSQCHVGDVGGPFPGSFNPIAKDLYEEAALVPPIKLVARRRAAAATCSRCTRARAARRTTSRCSCAARWPGINTVQARMAEVLDEYGPAVVKGAMRRMIRDARARSASGCCASPTASGRSASTWPAWGAEDRSAHRFVDAAAQDRRPARVHQRGHRPAVRLGQQRVRHVALGGDRRAAATSSAGTSCCATPARWTTSRSSRRRRR